MSSDATDPSSTRNEGVPRPRPRRILVVDDEPDIAEALTELLEHEGHEVRAVFDGRAALDAVATFKPEVVLLDLGLPRMDGYEVAKSLRQTSGDAILIIALTGYNKDTARLEQAGFDHHLIKPPSLRKISDLLAASPAR